MILDALKSVGQKFVEDILNTHKKLIFIFLFFIYSYVFIQFSVDDSLITFRYAKNFLQYGIWNWNPTNYDYVESYTNAIYAFLAIIPLYLGINPSLFFKLAHLILFVYFIKRIYSINSDNITIFYILSFAGVYVHMYSGLETFVFVLIICELFFIIENKSRKYDDGIFYVLIALFPFIRPEGVLFSIFFLYLYSKKYYNQTFLKNVFLITVFWLTYFVIRFNYFHILLPNTFYVKSDIEFSIEKYVNDLYQFKYEIILMIFSFFAIKNFNLRWLILLVIAILLFYAKSDLQMNYAHRFAFQVSFPILVIILMNLGNVENKFYKILIVLLLVIISISSFKASKSVIKDQYSNTLYILHDMSEKLSKYKNNNILLIGDAGVVPYKSNWETIDSIGLANSYIAHHKTINIEYLEKKDPTLLFLYSANKENGEFDMTSYHQQDIINYIREYNEKYQKVGYITWNNAYYYAVYLKKDNKNFFEIKNILNDAINLSNMENTPTDWYHHLKGIIQFKYFKDELY